VRRRQGEGNEHLHDRTKRATRASVPLAGRGGRGSGVRIASRVLAVFWALAALLVLRRAGYRFSVFSFEVARAGTWLLAVLLTLGVLMNIASASDWERFLQAPIAAIMATLCFHLARSAQRP
jgi:hypothetical protein